MSSIGSLSNFYDMMWGDIELPQTHSLLHNSDFRPHLSTSPPLPPTCTRRTSPQTPNPKPQTSKPHRLLTGIPITSIASIRQALTILHTQHNVPHVVISSIPLSDALALELAPFLGSLTGATKNSGEKNTGEKIEGEEGSEEESEKEEGGAEPPISDSIPIPVPIRGATNSNGTAGAFTLWGSLTLAFSKRNQFR